MTGITVLGPVGVGDQGSPLPPRDRVVLSVLVARRGHEVPADTIAEALWGEHLPPSWHKVVQGCIARLRRRLGHDAIVTDRGGYRLSVPPESVDAGRFERLVHHAGDLLALHQPDQAAFTTDEALALWRGMPLADLVDWPPGRGEAERLGELRLHVEELRLEALLASGRVAEALPEARARVQEEPLREHRWALLTRALYQDGRQAEALTTIRQARDTLADELGLDPGPELAALEHAVLRQDPDLAVPVAETVAAGCPWPGLASYDVQDADSFFGRDAEVAECLERLDRTGLLAVVGPSGSGKSSLVRAGLAARLRHLGRQVVVLTPGPRSLDALVPPAGTSATVLVIDQGEEIFAPTVPLTVRSTFLHQVTEQAARGPVVLTLRADRLGELAVYPRVARLVEDGLYLLTPLDTRGVCEAIERPARRAGLLLEQGLVDLLVREVEGEPGSLPLLTHALRETWARRVGSTLTVEGYRASGGIRGAVAQSAERIYQAATEEQRRALRELLLRLVQPGPAGEPVRTSVSRSVVDDEHAPVVEQLVRARLVTAHTDRLEITHEALVRAWPRLQAWLAEDVEGERLRHHLAAAAQAWDAMDRPASELYRGARLAAAREWRDTGLHRLTTLERAFLDAGDAAERSELTRAQHEARRQRRLNRRLRLLAVGAVVLALVAVTFGTLARLQWQEAGDARAAAQVEADAARAQETLARSQELAAASVAAVGQDPALARTLAVLSAAEGRPTPQSTDALHRALFADHVVARTGTDRAPGRLWAVLHPEGDRVAMTAEHAYQPADGIEVRDPRTGALVWEWVPPEEPEYGSVVVAGAEYSPDGTVLTGGVLRDPAGQVRPDPVPDQPPPPPEGVVGVHVWDATTHELLQVVDVGPCGGWPVAVAGDALLVRTLAARPSDGLDAAGRERFLRACPWQEGAIATLLVDRSTGRSRQVSITEDLNITLTVGHALSDDGSLAVVPDLQTWDAVLLDVPTGREVGRTDNAVALDLDSTGEHLLTIDVIPFGNDLWRIVSVPGLETEVTYTGRSSWSSYGRFSSDDATVWTTGTENALVQWDAGTGIHLRTLPAVGSGAPSVAGTRVLVPRPETAGAVLLETRPHGDLWSVPSCGGAAGTDRLRVTDTLVVVGRDCDPAPGGRVETLTTAGEAVASHDLLSWEAFEVSPDGRRVVGREGALDPGTGAPHVGALTVRDLRTGAEVVELEGLCDHALITSLASVEGGDPAAEGCRRFPDAPFRFMTGSVAWSPDGRWIAAASEGLGVWDARTGELVTTLGGTGSAANQRWGLPWDLSFTDDSRRLLMTTLGRYVVPVDTTTWEPGPPARLQVQSAHSAGLVGTAADGALVVVTPLHQIAGSTTVLLLDPDDLEVRQRWDASTDASVQSAALSPDGTRLALARSDGLVTVWDLAKQSRVDQAGPGLGRLDGVRWLSDRHLVVLSASGHVTTVTTDADELLGLARESLWRGLTQAECTSHALPACPTLADLRGDGPVVSPGLQGSYEVTWGADELRTTLLRWARESLGDLDPDSGAFLAEQAELAEGTLRLQLRGSDYTVSRGDGEEVWCTGSVSPSPSDPDRLVLWADAGERCTDVKYAELGWRVDGDRLVLPRGEFRGDDVDRVLWTSKPLERTG
ncbi:BTAD domain-containing putative transcriptional regulator [Ornithinimicrobium pekingense]|uniref:OmpR/PhoB-type domain-containing protein n=1 Tax=Ornithinimicrobium pekingense TaxID=384677 RepID=A0ABQ2F608_9MICO|nr:BTAD domain-containing putative transcriptional regulator [Ornithinimicrobium pekingense]GGK57157.1 hypothetical protein GCM10011509_01940 [Ornithinimicrobium pekingense]